MFHLKISSIFSSILILVYFHFVQSEIPTTTHLNSTENLLDWEPPALIQQTFPYFLSGYDKTGVPVWIVEFGKWDIASFLDKHGLEYRIPLMKYVEQMAERITTPQLFSLDGNVQDKFLTIANIEGFSVEQLKHRPTLQTLRQMTRNSIQMLERKNFNVKRAYYINANTAFEKLWSLFKPLLGRLVDYVEIYGANSAKWKSVLLSRISADQMPEWIGGYKNFTPVKFYG